MYFCVFVKLLCGGVFLKKFFYLFFQTLRWGILFYLIKKVSKKIKPDSNRPRLLFYDRIYFVIASNPAKAGAHFGSYCIFDSFLDIYLFGSHESGICILEKRLKQHLFPKLPIPLQARFHQSQEERMWSVQSGIEFWMWLGSSIVFMVRKFYIFHEFPIGR